MLNPPHSADTVLIYVPEERVLFLGDSTSEDYYNNGYLDKTKLHSLMKVIEGFDCEYCILSHTDPIKKVRVIILFKESSDKLKISPY